jgi:D-alanyl-D-alanine carboxypeptidase (penicillin-binding protein 5/6)
MLKKIIFVLGFNLIFSNLALANLDVEARTAILQDYLSGEILYEKDPDHSIHPASMTKIMTAIVAFDLIKSGNIKFRG